MKKGTQLCVIVALLMCVSSQDAISASADPAPVIASEAPKPSVKPPGDPASPSDCPPTRNFSEVAVTQVYLTRKPESIDGSGTKPVVRLRHEITIKVAHLQALLEREQCSAQHKKVVLFLDGRPLKELRPYPPTSPSSDTLNFVLERNETSRDVWTHLLGKPTFKNREISVSVGLEDESPVPSTSTLLLEVIPFGWFALWATIFFALVAIFWALAVHSDVLRDTGPQPALGSRKPYSLARTQAAVWFFLILASYLFIGLVTGDYGSTITGTVLGLMGISAGTAVGSSVIDQGRVSPPPSSAATIVIPPASVTKGRWWLDILSDEQGVNFHRFQMASWTLVLSIIFIQQVYRSLAMPDFDNTLLGLLGISAGTYLGLKTTSEPR